MLNFAVNDPTKGRTPHTFFIVDGATVGPRYNRRYVTVYVSFVFWS